MNVRTLDRDILVVRFSDFECRCGYNWGVSKVIHARIAISCTNSVVVFFSSYQEIMHLQISLSEYQKQQEAEAVSYDLLFKISCDLLITLVV